MDNPPNVMLLSEISPAWFAKRVILRKQWKRRSLGSIFLCLFWAAIPLHGQNDLARQASELMQAGKFHDAELLWRQLEQQDPKNASIHSNLGVALAQQGQFDAATAEYRKSLALKPHQPEVVFNLGIAEFKQGHFSAAIPAFELLAKEKPDDPRSTLSWG